MKVKPIESYTKEELYSLLQQNEIAIKLLQQEICDIKEVLRLANTGGNHGIINNVSINK